MKRSIVTAAALLCLFPAGAGAQGVPMRPYVGPPATSGTAGITVNGSAVRRVPATSAVLTLHLETADRRMTLDAKKLAPLMDALVQAGANPTSVHLPINFSAPGASNAASISATIDRPTAAEFMRGVTTIGRAVAGITDLVLSGADVRLTSAHCGAAFASVRDEALADAHAKAVSIAQALHVRVGEPVDVRALDAIAADGSCVTQYFVGAYSGPQSPQTPQDYVTVPVSASVTITYAIK